MPRLVGLALRADAGAWRDAGFEVAADGTCRVGAVALSIGAPPAGGRTGVVAWSFAGLTGEHRELDGLPTSSAEPPGGGAPGHPVGAASVDHLVVTTPDLPRTIGALAAAGLAALRERDTGTEERPTRQVFLRPGEVVVEVVGPRRPSGDGAARFWGLTFTVADLDAAVAHLGPLLGRAKDAVQPGRRIATVRPEAGLGLPVALMTPDVRR